MIDREHEARILRLFHVEKWKIGTIADQLGVHHDVVRRVLDNDGLPRPRTERPSRIDPYLPFILDTLRRHQLNERVKLIRSDGFDALQGGYDLIVSNPPYVPDDSYRNLPEEYLHEPEIGLRAGPDGLDIVASMLTEAPRFMNPGALLVVEVGEAREALTARFSRLPFLWLDFERGGDDVFALTKEELEKG